MAPTNSQPVPFRLGEWEVHPDVGLLCRRDESVRIEPRPMQVLMCLASHPGQVVSHEELMRVAWDGVHVAPVALPRCISVLRASLGDRARPHRIIETHPKRGYRLIAPVAPLAVEAPVIRRWARWLAAAATAAIAALLSMVPGVPAAAPPVVPVAAVIDAPMALVARADDYYRRFQFADSEKAISLYERAAELDPSLAAAYAGAANGYVRRFRYYGQGVEQLGAGFAAARRALVLDPGLADAHKALGFAHSTAGRLHDALTSYRRALALDPDHADSVNNIGVILWSLGRWNEALPYLRRRADMQPDSPQALGNLADILAALGAAEDARGWYERTSAIDPLYPSMHISLAYEETFAGQAQDARDRIDRIVRGNPGCLSCLMVLVEVELIEGNRAAALAALRPYRERAPTEAYGLLREAQLRWHEQPELAADLLAQAERKGQAALDGGSEASKSRWLLAAAAGIRGDQTTALARLEEAYERGRLNWRFDLREPAFEQLRESERFRAVIRGASSRVAEMAAMLAIDGAPTLPPR